MARHRSLLSLLPAPLLVAVSACGQGTVAQSAPGLTGLSVSPLALTPSYSQGAQDYYVRCSEGSNALTLDYALTNGTTIAISTPSGAVAAEGGTAKVTVQQNELITLSVRVGSQSLDYYVRCLPADFPQMSFTPHSTSITPGWYLVGNAQAWSGESGYAMVLDPNGTPVWYERVGATGAMDVDLQPNGDLSYIPDLGAYGETPGAAWTLQSLDPSGMSSVKAVGCDTDEHELLALPNGDWLITTYPLLANQDLSGLAGYGPGWTIADCTIQEISPTGALVWSWKASDHVDPVRELSLPQNNVVNGVIVADVYHLNSIDVDPLGNLLVSMRDMDTLYYIDKSTGTIQWKLGGVKYGKDGEQYLFPSGDPETTFHRQHDGRFQTLGCGTSLCVSVFDDHTNASDHTNGVSRGVEYEIDLGAGTAKMIWQYQSGAESIALGSFRRYSDGSNLISWGVAPENTASVTEVDDHGNDLLDFAFFNDDATYRAVKVPLSSLDAAALRANAMVSPPDTVEADRAVTRAAPIPPSARARP